MLCQTSICGLFPHSNCGTGRPTMPRPAPRADTARPGRPRTDHPAQGPSQAARVVRRNPNTASPTVTNGPAQYYAFSLAQPAARRCHSNRSCHWLPAPARETRCGEPLVKVHKRAVGGVYFCRGSRLAPKAANERAHRRSADYRHRGGVGGAAVEGRMIKDAER